MLNLPMEHPEVYEHLKNRGMFAQLGIASTFVCILVDQGNSKGIYTAGGTKRFSLNPGVIIKCYLATEDRGICLQIWGKWCTKSYQMFLMQIENQQE